MYYLLYNHEKNMGFLIRNQKLLRAEKVEGEKHLQTPVSESAKSPEI